MLPERFCPAVVPYLQSAGTEISSGVNVGAPNANNQAYYLPVYFPEPCTIYELAFVAGNATGTFDIGLYDSSFNALARKGSTAMAAARQTLVFSDIAVTTSTLYYAAIVLSSTSGTMARLLTGSTVMPTGAQQAAALPLPAAATPVTATFTVMPVVWFSVR